MMGKRIFLMALAALLSVAVLPAAAQAQLELYPTTVSINAPGSYDSSSKAIDLLIRVDIDPVSLPNRIPLNSNIQDQFDVSQLIVNGHRIDMTDNCIRVSSTRFDCSYTYQLSEIERRSRTLKFGGMYIFAIERPTAGGGHPSVFASKGTMLKCNELAVNIPPTIG